MREVSEVDETLFGENSDTGTTTSLTSDTSASREASSVAQQGKGNKKRKRSRGDQFEVVMNKVMEELISSQKPNI